MRAPGAPMCENFFRTVTSRSAWGVTIVKRRDFVRSSLFAAAAALPGARSLYTLAAEAGQIADIPAVTGDGRAITLRASDISAFAAQLRGPLLLAKDRGYDAARHVLN